MPSQPTKPVTGEPVITDEVRNVADLKPDPQNARRHSEAQISQIATSIERFGFVNPVAIRANGQLIGGHATLDALKRLGRESVACRVVSGLSERDYKALAIALNKLPENSRWDDDILRGVLLEIQDDGENALSLGFSPGELGRILDTPDELEVKEIETGAVDDEFWISVRGPLSQQPNALKALEAAMKPFGGVTVEQGTINIG